MKRIFAASLFAGLFAGLFTSLVIVPASATAIVEQSADQPAGAKVATIDWQPPQLTQEFEAKVLPRATDTSQARRLRQLELLQQQAEKAQARAAKLQRMRQAESSS